MTYKCHGPTFQSIRNPYTGDPIAVEMLVSPNGVVLMRAVDTYSPGGTPFPTPEEAFRAWDRKDGVGGLRSAEARGVFCAWTGAPLVPRHTPRGWIYAGGFNPSVFTPRMKFLELMAGVAETASRVEAPKPKGEVTPAMRRGAAERSASPDAETERTAAGIMESLKKDLDPSGVVSMATPASLSKSNPKAGNPKKRGK